MIISENKCIYQCTDVIKYHALVTESDSELVRFSSSDVQTFFYSNVTFGRAFVCLKHEQRRHAYGFRKTRVHDVKKKKKVNPWKIGIMLFMYKQNAHRSFECFLVKNLKIFIHYTKLKS